MKIILSQEPVKAPARVVAGFPEQQSKKQHQ